MAAYKKGTTGVEYSVNYSMMGGVDFSSPDSISGRRRYSYLENMYRDYDGEGAELTESVPGFRKILSLDARINGFYFQRIANDKDYLIIHAGTKIYRKPLKDIDNGEPPTSLRTVNDAKSSGFSFGKHVYILDGSKIGRIDEGGTMNFVTDGGSAAPYVPTTYVNGEEYEQLNLLTRQFREELYVAFPEDIAYESAGIEYRISDKELKKCELVGANDSFTGDLFIPRYAKIGGEKYAIEKIREAAFSNNIRIRSLTIADGIEEIGARAFSNCENIMWVKLPDSVRVIGDGAFEDCVHIEEVRLGRELSKIGTGAFANCTNLELVKYALDSAAFEKISANSGITISDTTFLSTFHKDETITAFMPVKTPTETVVELYIEDERITFYENYEGGVVTGIIIPEINKKLLEASLLRMRGYADREKYNLNTPGINFISGMEGEEPSEAIKRCTVCECFDGRVFLSGNPSFPNTVFYSARDKEGNINPLYFGVMNFFNDGVGGFPIISLLSAGDSLAVFKSGDDGSGSIFYHVPKETGIDILPKIYPVSYVHSGIFAVGKSISFFDDPIFISGVGVSALDKKAINLERSIVCRSHNINPELLSKNLASASLAVWCGYLALLVDGKIFLADSRAPFTHETGSTEYEWYYLTGIGTYQDDSFVYEYIKSDTRECETREGHVGEEANGIIFGAISDEGLEYFYTEEDATRYRVAKTGEKRGGSFNAATTLFGIDNKLLLFGTDTGEVCIFNNDKRGIPPTRLSEAEDFDLPAYEKRMQRSLHPDFYSFDKHAPRYALSTVTDDGGIHDMTKDSVKGSLVLKCKSFGTGAFTVEAKTDKRGYRELASFSDAALDFEDFDFSTLAFTSEKRINIPIAEKEKGWCEKQISIYSERFASPIGIYSISYRFKPRGKIKKIKF